MSVFVKICGLKDPADVRAAVDAGADAIGFVFAESVRRVTPAEALLASRDVPRAVRRVAVMRHPQPADWREVLDGFGPDVLQTDAEDFGALEVPDSVERWPVLREGFDESLDLPRIFLYEGRVSGAGETVDWTRAADIARRGRMILAGGLTAANVAEAIATVAPWGVDVSTAVESSRGVKDPARIRQFIDAAKAAGTV